MLTNLIQKSLAAIAKAKGLDEAISMARFFGEILWKNNIGQYELIALENTLIEKYSSQFTTSTTSETRFPYLHVLTKAYDTGGHTRLVDRLIQSKAMQDSAVMVTEFSGPNTLKKLSTAKHGFTQINKRSNSQTRIQAMIDVLARCKTVILHIHPHDIETVIAVAVAKREFGINVLMYNHADHVFSYGHSVADRVLEISYFGWALRHLRQSEQKSVFVGIPLKLPDPTTAENQRQDDGYLTAAGSAYKFKPGQGYSFPDFLSSLTKKISIPFVLIGPQPLRNWWWWKTLFSTKFDALSNIRFAPKMPHEQYLKYLQNTTAFVDSFPMTGGTAFPEIVSLGVPCFGVLTGAHGYTPADQLKSLTLQKLTEDLTNFLKTAQRPSIDIKSIRDQLYNTHDTELVAQRVVTAMECDVKKSTPNWTNPTDIDAKFYEKGWYEKTLFSIPVHTRPNANLLFFFLNFWWKKNREN